MNNHVNEFHSSREKTHTQEYGAHSGSRSGLSDYNDGGQLSHYGGNEDSYSNHTESEDDFDGKVAYGNENEEVDDEEEDLVKYHSGL